ncbi:hypothetical protein LUZ62_047555 [Rhynchospora pubera]|uniref:Uncharacterized protein n=1 Tax=Rhynchospora pubera TaxID=906938 RepID=A0AAV8FS22_9POAL|nr:hypothetical protein LUZ62_047555 [Rhynchospora pubera]
MGGGSPARSSSSDEDGDAEWRAAIDSIASVGFGVPQSNGSSSSKRESRDTHSDDEPSQKSGLKLYQIKAQKLLDEYLEKNLEVVRMPDPHVSEDSSWGGGGVIKLFSKAPRGITLKEDTKFVQNKRPRILPGEETDEKSKKFKRQISSVTVDGTWVIALAREACEKSLARYKAMDAAAKEKAKREEERVSELKKIRGEMWLPSIAKQMQEDARRK